MAVEEAREAAEGELSSQREAVTQLQAQKAEMEQRVAEMRKQLSGRATTAEAAQIRAQVVSSAALLLMFALLWVLDRY